MAYSMYQYDSKLCEYTDNDKESKNSKKDLKKKASKLYSEYKKIPENLQFPELEEKIKMILSLD